MSCASIGIGGALAIGGLAAAGGVAGAIISSNAAGNAAQTEASATDQASQLQYQAEQQALGIQQQEFGTLNSNAQPYMQAGASALSQMGNPSFNQPYTMADFQQDPSYQFDLSQGQQAIEQAAAAQGGLKSGGMLKSIAQYTQGMASNDYQNAFNNYQTQQNNSFNRLSTVAGMGLTATGQVASAGMNSANAQSNIVTGTGNNLSNLASSLGNAQAASTIAQGNIAGGTLSSLGSQIPNSIIGANNAGNLNSILDRMYPKQQQPAVPSGSLLAGQPQTLPASIMTDYATA